MTVEIHKFEKAGLGKAPFRVIGVERRVGPIRMQDARGFEVQVGAPGQPMGCCDYCGTGIAECWTIRSADGHQFIVGCDCVKKTGDAGLVKQADPMVRKLRREARHASEAARIAEFEKLMDDTDAPQRLREMPHPKGFSGQSMLDWTNWMWQHSGTAGKLKTLRAVKKALGV